MHFSTELHSVKKKKTPENMYKRGECHSWQQNGWDTTSQDYREDVSRIARMPSDPNMSRYPNVRTTYSDKVTWEEESDSRQNHHHRNHHHRSPQFQEKVEVVEFKEERVRNNRDEEFEVVEEVVDVKANGFIQQKHRGFEMSKWNTFKA